MSETFRPYSGIRILDLTHDLGRYATRLFADLGAEVTRIEPPGGLPDRARETEATPGGAETFAFHNASKHSRILDLTGNEGRAAFADLARDAQVVVMERGGPLGEGDTAWLRRAEPHLRHRACLALWAGRAARIGTRLGPHATGRGGDRLDDRAGR